MTVMDIGEFVKRAALVGSTVLLSTCAAGSITSPPFMRPVPDGPALAGRRVGMASSSHGSRTRLADRPVAHAVQS
jgi:hypothetical protein